MFCGRGGRENAGRLSPPISDGAYNNIGVPFNSFFKLYTLADLLNQNSFLR